MNRRPTKKPLVTTLAAALMLTAQGVPRPSPAGAQPDRPHLSNRREGHQPFQDVGISAAIGAGTAVLYEDWEVGKHVPGKGAPRIVGLSPVGRMTTGGYAAGVAEVLLSASENVPAVVRGDMGIGEAGADLALDVAIAGGSGAAAASVGGWVVGILGTALGPGWGNAVGYGVGTAAGMGLYMGAQWLRKKVGW